MQEPRQQHKGAEVVPHPSSIHGELEYRLKQQAVVAELGGDALLGVDLDALFDKTVQLVASVLNNEYCKVLELLPGGDFVFLRAGVGWRDGLVRKATVDTGLNSQAGYTLISKEPVIVKDLRTETRFDGPLLLREHGIVSGMSVIIHGRNGPWGVLGTHTKRYHEFTQDDINFFQAIANILANAIERRRFETELQNAAQMLEERVQQRTQELAKAKGELQELARVVSHELQGPLRLIVSHEGLLTARYKGKLGVDADEFLAVITSSSQKIQRMIDDLWLYARIDTSQNHATPIDTNALCKSVIAGLAREISDARARISLGDLPNVTAVTNQVEYLFDQLIRNALLFRQKSVAPEISVEALQRQGSMWLFVVSDNGIGFDIMDAQNVFKMFHRLNGEHYPGTGMGLTICKKIVEFAGGNIWAQSEPGKGTNFYFTLPAD